MDNASIPCLDEEDIRAGDVIVIQDIEWDIDDEDPEDLGLPDEVKMTVPKDWDEDSSIADHLSDEYGFCVNDIGKVRRA